METCRAATGGDGALTASIKALIWRPTQEFGSAQDPRHSIVAANAPRSRCTTRSLMRTESSLRHVSAAHRHILPTVSSMSSNPPTRRYPTLRVPECKTLLRALDSAGPACSILSWGTGRQRTRHRSQCWFRARARLNNKETEQYGYLQHAEHHDDNTEHRGNHHAIEGPRRFARGASFR